MAIFICSIRFIGLILLMSTNKKEMEFFFVWFCFVLSRVVFIILVNIELELKEVSVVCGVVLSSLLLVGVCAWCVPRIKDEVGIGRCVVVERV